MKCKRKPLLLALAVTALFAAGGGYADAVTTYGTLSNFDVVNDTGQPCHGFEIEMEGISPSDIVYKFGAPYERYGDPTVVATPTGVIVRYASSYNNGAWTATTPLAPSPTPVTLGHQCWSGGDPNYATSGCEHFGLSLVKNPAKTTYRWLVENASQPGTLSPIGSSVSIPAPVWSVVPQPAAPPVVVAAVQAPPPPAEKPEDPEPQWGEAQWMKIFTTELPEEVHPEDLNHLVLNAPDKDIVPNEPAEVEIEWQLLQSAPAGEKGANQESDNGGQVGDGKNAVSRRYEFYKYAGEYNPESHEALCDDQKACPEAVGDFIGAQNAAVNLVPVILPDALCKDVTVPAEAGVCGASASVDNGSFDQNGGPVTLSQSPAGPYGIGSTPVTLTVTDQNGAVSSCTATVTVVDNQPPVVTALASQSIEATRPRGAIASFAAPTAADNCSVAAKGCAPASGSLFPLGTTTVNCTVTDASGNAAGTSFTVTVNDTTPPAVTAPAAVTIPATETGGARGSASAALAAFLAAGSATDTADPAPLRLSPQVGGADANNTTLFPVGATAVTFRFRDGSGNIGTQYSTVNVLPCAANVSSSVLVQRAGYVYNFTTNRFYQKVTLTNTGGSTVTGPISLALDSLSGNAALYNGSGTTGCVAPIGSAYINVSPANLAPGAAVSAVLQFTNPTKAAITYSTRVLAGAGTR